MSSFWIARYTPGAFGRLYTLSEQDLSVIKRRGDANRLGFAVLLCCLRYPGYALSAGEDPPHTFLTMISAQLGVGPEIWAEYAGREETRREHLSELRTLSIAESDFSTGLSPMLARRRPHGSLNFSWFRSATKIRGSYITARSASSWPGRSGAGS
jgi:hypothetical protein